MLKKNLISAIKDIKKYRNISKDIICSALKEALIKAFYRQLKSNDVIIDVIVNRKTFEIKLIRKFLIVKNNPNIENEIEYKKVKKLNANFKIGKFFYKKEKINNLGRSATLLAKNIIKQKIREAERNNIFNHYIKKIGEMVIAMVESIEKKKVIVLNLGKALAIMPRFAQVNNETYYEGQTLKVVIINVNKDTKGAQILVSRSEELLVKRLFENEVPEISDKQVEIRSIARFAGERTKIAVFSNHSDIDPVGACIGFRGSRIRVIIKELKGEKIDVFEWNKNQYKFIQNSLFPVEPIAIFNNKKNNSFLIILDDEKLSLVIGKKGRNIYLISKLLNKRIEAISLSNIKNNKNFDYKKIIKIYNNKNKEKIEKNNKKHYSEKNKKQRVIIKKIFKNK